MRYTYLHVGALTAIGNAQIGRDAEWRAMHRRPDALPLPDEPARDGWAAGWRLRLARRRPAARANRALG